MKIDDVTKLPDKVPDDEHEIVDNSQVLEDLVHQSWSVYEESQRQVELNREGEHGEAGVSYEALEEPFSSPLCLITQNTKKYFNLNENYFNFQGRLCTISPDNVAISQEDKQMMNYSGSCNLLVDEDVGQVLAGVHGGHVDQYLRVGSVGHGVQNTDVTIHDCFQSNTTVRVGLKERVFNLKARPF